MIIYLRLSVNTGHFAASLQQYLLSGLNMIDGESPTQVVERDLARWSGFNGLVLDTVPNKCYELRQKVDGKRKALHEVQGRVVCHGLRKTVDGRIEVDGEGIKDTNSSNLPSK